MRGLFEGEFVMRLANILGMCIISICLSGCGPKLDEKVSFNLGMGESKPYNVEAIKNEQKIKITGNTEGGLPVTVYVYLKSKRAAAQNEIMTKKSTQSIIAKQDKTDTINLEALIPANEEAEILVESPGKSVKGQLRITNK
jgi:hypothetical protein